MFNESERLSGDAAEAEGVLDRVRKPFCSHPSFLKYRLKESFSRPSYLKYRFIESFSLPSYLKNRLNESFSRTGTLLYTILCNLHAVYKWPQVPFHLSPIYLYSKQGAGCGLPAPGLRPCKCKPSSIKPQSIERCETTVHVDTIWTIEATATTTIKRYNKKKRSLS